MKVLSLTGASTKVGYMFGILRAIYQTDIHYDKIICTSATAIIMLHVVSGKWLSATKLIVSFTNKEIFGRFKPMYNNGIPTPIAFWRFFTGKNSLGKQANLLNYMKSKISREMFEHWKNDNSSSDILVYVFSDKTKTTELINLREYSYEKALDYIEASSNIPVFINPKEIDGDYYFDGGSIDPNASALFIEKEKSSITHLDSIWQRKSPIDTLKDMQKVQVGWIPKWAWGYIMKLMFPSKSLLTEKYQNTLCELYGIKVRNFYSYTEVDTQYDNEANEKLADIRNGYERTKKILKSV